MSPTISGCVAQVGDQAMLPSGLAAFLRCSLGAPRYGADDTRSVVRAIMPLPMVSMQLHAIYVTTPSFEHDAAHHHYRCIRH